MPQVAPTVASHGHGHRRPNGVLPRPELASNTDGRARPRDRRFDGRPLKENEWERSSAPLTTRPRQKRHCASAVRLSDEAGLRLVAVHVEERVRRRIERPRLRRSNAAGSCSTDCSPTQGLNGGADKRVEVGERANELARVAAEEAASVILVGSRRRHWWRGRRTSKLTADLAATAACPVVVVPPARRR